MAWKLLTIECLSSTMTIRKKTSKLRVGSTMIRLSFCGRPRIRAELKPKVLQPFK